MKLTFWLVCAFYSTACFAVEEVLESSEISIVSVEEPEGSSSRTGRKLLKKLHSGAAFLAGFKFGSYLTNKGSLIPLAGQGSLATSNTFQLFGKTVSSALSLSYGNALVPLPLHDPVDSESSNSSVIRSPMQHVVVTVLENPTSEMLEKLKSIAKISEDAYSRNRTSEAKAKQQRNQLNNLVQSHNKRIQLLNLNQGQVKVSDTTENPPRRTNSKF